MVHPCRGDGHDEPPVARHGLGHRECLRATERRDLYRPHDIAR